MGCAFTAIGVGVGAEFSLFYFGFLIFLAFLESFSLVLISLVIFHAFSGFKLVSTFFFLLIADFSKRSFAFSVPTEVVKALKIASSKVEFMTF